MLSPREFRWFRLKWANMCLYTLVNYDECFAIVMVYNHENRPIDLGHLALLLPSCRLPVAFLSLFWHFQPPVAPLPLACRFPVAVLSLPCRSPVASLSLSRCPPVAFLSLPVASCCFLSPCYFLPGAFLSLSRRSPVVPSCCSPVAPLLLSCRPPVAFLSLPVASCRFLSPCYSLPGAFPSLSCRSPVVPSCRSPVAISCCLPVALLSLACRSPAASLSLRHIVRAAKLYTHKYLFFLALICL